jgi:DNA-binding CsgD family transcriptional regulator
LFDKRVRTAVSDMKILNASELWEAMRESRYPFALIDPVAHDFVDLNDQYSALWGVAVSDLMGTSVLSLYDEEIARDLEGMNAGFARGTLQYVRGQGAYRTPNGTVIELKGWARRIEGISEHPLVVTSAVDAKSAADLPDDRHWVAQAPHLFGLADGLSETSRETANRRADQLEQHLWRIGMEVRAAGLVPVGGQTFPLSPIREFGELTTRQREIVGRLVAGERVTEIARDMYLSPSTIRNHLTAVFHKFGVHSQVELISLLRNATQPPLEIGPED